MDCEPGELPSSATSVQHVQIRDYGSQTESAEVVMSTQTETLKVRDVSVSTDLQLLTAPSWIWDISTIESFMRLIHANKVDSSTQTECNCSHCRNDGPLLVGSRGSQTISDTSDKQTLTIYSSDNVIYGQMM